MQVLITDTGGVVHTLTAQIGDRVMVIARASGLPVKGECEGSVACATCHMVVDPIWASLLDAPGEEEEAMLDTVFDLTPTSRLSCQIRMVPALDGLSLRLP